MPKKGVKYSSDPNDRVKNKDGTVKRFPYELFPGDVVVSRYGWPHGEHRVLSLVGTNRVQLEGRTQLDYQSSWRVKRKAY
jgi:hypothetical protein